MRQLLPLAPISLTVLTSLPSTPRTTPPHSPPHGLPHAPTPRLAGVDVSASLLKLGSSLYLLPWIFLVRICRGCFFDHRCIIIRYAAHTGFAYHFLYIRGLFAPASTSTSMAPTFSSTLLSATYKRYFAALCLDICPVHHLLPRAAPSLLYRLSHGTLHYHTLSTPT